VSGEIEFLDLEPAPDASATGGRTASGATAWSAAALLGWTAAAVLAVAASWQMVYQFPLGTTDGTYGVDGWGRPHVQQLGEGFTAGHAGRFGIVLCCAAALLILAAAWTLVEQVRALRSGRTVRGRVASHLGLAATALCAGTAATVYLDVRATADSLALERDPGYHGPALTYGPFLWCCLGAVGCGLAGTIARLLATRTPDRAGR
jgi:hypothetical protein